MNSTKLCLPLHIDDIDLVLVIKLAAFEYLICQRFVLIRGTLSILLAVLCLHVTLINQD